MLRQCTAACTYVIGLLWLVNSAPAATRAYWRFEDRNGMGAVAGESLVSTIPGGTPADITSDSSGNGNELRTFHSPNNPSDPDFRERLETSPTFSLDVLSPTVRSTGAVNRFSINCDAANPQAQQPPGTPPNDAAGDDFYSQDGNNVPGPINSLSLNQFTVEASFKVDGLGRFQKVVGKDPGNLPPGGLGPFSLGLLSNNVLEVFAFDGSATFRNVLGDQMHPGMPGPGRIEAGVWYNVAATNDGSTMRLYLDDTRDGVGNYNLLGVNNAITGGALIVSDGNWSVGRGWFNQPADYWDGKVDEVRISDVALAPSEFLFAIPEPASMSLICLGIASLMRRSRTCRD